MTFTLPDSVASSFTRRVPARDRSRYVAEAIAEKLAEREKRLIQACEIVNNDPAVREIEAQTIGTDERALLGRLGPQNGAESPMQQVGCRVIPARRQAQIVVDNHFYRVANG